MTDDTETSEIIEEDVTEEPLKVQLIEKEKQEINPTSEDTVEIYQLDSPTQEEIDEYQKDIDAQ